jgi:hypothetical protein
MVARVHDANGDTSLFRQNVTDFCDFPTVGQVEDASVREVVAGSSL